VVARSVGSSRRAAVVGMTWPVPAELDRKALERKRFAPSRCKRHGAAGSPRRCGKSMQRDEKLLGQAELVGPVASLNDRHHQGTFFRDASTLPKLVNCKQSSSRAVGPEPGGWFFLDRPQAGPSTI
jgi:hypothetical protein